MCGISSQQAFYDVKALQELDFIEKNHKDIFMDKKQRVKKGKEKKE